MEKRPLEVPTLTEEDFRKILPPSMMHRGLDVLFGHFAPSYLKQIATRMNSYTWFRFVEQESKSMVLKRMVTRVLYRMLKRENWENISAGNDNNVIYDDVAVGLTSRGVNYKPVNEDGFGIFKNEDHLSLVVCDGVGDCLVGEVASLVILNQFRKFPQKTAAQNFMESVEVLTRLGTELEKEIPEFVTFPNEVSQAAVTSVKITGNNAEIGQVGDVLLYLVREDTIKLLDQNRVWLDLVELKRLFADEHYLSQRHIITNAVGRNYDPYWTPTTLELEDNDLLILASDGLETLHPQDLLELAKKDLPPKEMLHEFYNRAIDANLKWNTLGAPVYTKPDNISIVLYRHKAVS